ncbi:hypothetical protein H5407_09135 [Mitsuaria sp. WAJ17]|uniref:hypothetical protein n=1 Tax=Mitsuaria sp. WAJ17 TaxID=2761452 RepID=UPI001603D7DC|nr:hypothetical protein [Mitsuaria sp. WAJ17]MBB2485389.1 hypothetical protein [Mitsuaria sp. WAJ17]
MKRFNKQQRYCAAQAQKSPPKGRLNCPGESLATTRHLDEGQPSGETAKLYTCGGTSTQICLTFERANMQKVPSEEVQAKPATRREKLLSDTTAVAGLLFSCTSLVWQVSVLLHQIQALMDVLSNVA